MEVCLLRVDLRRRWWWVLLLLPPSPAVDWRRVILSFLGLLWFVELVLVGGAGKYFRGLASKARVRESKSEGSKASRRSCR